MKKILTLSALFLCLQSEAQMCFNTAVTYSEFSTPMTIASADFNKDGHPDLAIPRWSGMVSIRLNNGSGGFGASTTFTCPTQSTGIVSEDLNSDGNMDLIISSYNSGNISIMTGNGLGGFGTPVNIAVGTNLQALVMADFNADGIKDIVVTTTTPGANGMYTLLGTGGLSFATPVFYSMTGAPHNIAVADYNLDGKLDVATAHISSGAISVRLGTGTGTFSGATTVISGMNGTSHLATADFNADGKPDLVGTNYNINLLSVSMGNGLGGFGTKTDYTVGNNPYTIVTGDLDNDGNIDIASCEINSDRISVLKGDGTGAFTVAASYPVGDPSIIISKDFNADGKLDLATSNQNSSTMAVLINCNTVGIFESAVSENELNVYPNPGHGRFTFTSRTDGEFRITNVAGQFIESFQLKAGNEHTIDISSLDNGMYFIIGDKGGKRFLKQ